MEMRRFMLSAFFVIITVNIGIFADLQVSPVKCGVHECKKWEYCSSFETQCKSCANVCNRTLHNLFDETACTKDCQDYLHDILYMRIDGNSFDGNLRDLVQNDHSLIVVNQVLISIIIVVLIAIGAFKCWSWKKNNKVTLSTIKQKMTLKKSDNNANKSDGMNATSGIKPDLRLEMPTTGAQSDIMNSPATISTSISRRPAEDNTLDYAYDNPAMSTPSPNSRPHESSF